jgi:hypothetical protein
MSKLQWQPSGLPPLASFSDQNLSLLPPATLGWRMEDGTPLAFPGNP